MALNKLVVKGDNAEGFLDDEVSDYRSTQTLKADCNKARFAHAERVDAETALAIEVATGESFSPYSTSRKFLRMPA